MLFCAINIHAELAVITVRSPDNSNPLNQLERVEVQVLGAKHREGAGLKTIGKGYVPSVL